VYKALYGWAINVDRPVCYQSRHRVINGVCLTIHDWSHIVTKGQSKGLLPHLTRPHYWLRE
jgi:hypothetical protein